MSTYSLAVLKESWCIYATWKRLKERHNAAVRIGRPPNRTRSRSLPRNTERTAGTLARGWASSMDLKY